MNKMPRCTDPNCRNRGTSYKAHVEFCPSCRGEIALKYTPRQRLGNRVFTVERKLDSAFYNSDYSAVTRMYDKMEEITYHTFLNYVYIGYLNAYFNYAPCRSKGLMLLDDPTVHYYISIYRYKTDAGYKSRRVLLLKRKEYLGKDYPEELETWYMFSDPKTRPEPTIANMILSSNPSGDKRHLPPGMLDEYDEQW